MLESLFFEIGAIIILAALLSFVAYALRQPLILAYIVTGMLAGAAALNLARSPEIFEGLSQIGIAFLLFMVGLGLNWRSMREAGGSALATGIGQVIFTSIVGFFIADALGFDVLTSIFLSVAFAFSSTIIIVKMLMDKDDADTLYGRISIGFLLVQDLVAMVILLVLGALQTGSAIEEILAVSLTKGVVAVLLLVVASIWIIPSIIRYAARSQELLFLFSLGWCFTVAGLLTASGFGMEIGALLAGISLSGTVYDREILSRIRPLRDFFLIIFFIVLGTGLHPGTIDTILFPVMIFSLFILIGKPLIVILVMRALGHHPHTGFLAGTSVAQISEFSFIVIGAGVTTGLIPAESLAITASVGVLTIAGSAYLIQYNEELYQVLRPFLRFLEPKRSVRVRRSPRPADIILCGHHRMGSILLPRLKELKGTVMVLDVDPRVIDQMKEAGVQAVYGDCGDETVLGDLQFHDAKLIVSTIPELSVTTSLLEYLTTRNFKGVVVVTVRSQQEAEEAYAAGAHFVIVPNVLGAERFADLLKKNRMFKTKWQGMRM